jgi:hypothetical protein
MLKGIDVRVPSVKIQYLNYGYYELHTLLDVVKVEGLDDTNFI